MERNQAELRQLRELSRNANEIKDPDAASMMSSLSSMAMESDISQDVPSEPKIHAPTLKPFQDHSSVQRSSQVSTVEMDQNQADVMKPRERKQRSDENKEPYYPTVTEKEPQRNEGPISLNCGVSLSTAPRIKLVRTCPFAKRRLSTMEMERTQAELRQLREMKLAN